MDPPGDLPDITRGYAPDALDLESVKKLAIEEHDYELTYYSKESRLISFQPLPSDDIDDDSHEVRINVYWNSGTVGTCFDHPTRGKTQLFRRNIGMDDLHDVFQNPRVDNSGAGYYETMELDASDAFNLMLADNGLPMNGEEHNKHVDLLQETNQMLREQLNDSQRIVISGRDGFPIYATGGFSDGKWMLQRGELWGVDLSMANATNEETGEPVEEDVEMEVPIAALEDIEIRLGGVLYASSQSHEVYAQMEEQEWDHGNGKEVVCHFGGPVTGAWLPIRINGWSKDHWESIQNKDHARRRNDYRRNMKVFDVLLEEVTEKYPTATLGFYRLSFFGQCVEQMVDNLGLAPPDVKSNDREEAGLWNIANVIVSNLRAAGNDDIGEAFMKRVNDLQMAAYMMITINNESAEVVEGEIPSLVELQLESGGNTSDFLRQVQLRYNVVEGVGQII